MTRSRRSCPSFLPMRFARFAASTPFLAFSLMGQPTREKVQIFKRVFDNYCGPEIIKICCDFGAA
jgi:hypothetical protein